MHFDLHLLLFSNTDVIKSNSILFETCHEWAKFVFLRNVKLMSRWKDVSFIVLLVAKVILQLIFILSKNVSVFPSDFNSVVSHFIMSKNFLVLISILSSYIIHDISIIPEVKCKIYKRKTIHKFSENRHKNYYSFLSLIFKKKFSRWIKSFLLIITTSWRDWKAVKHLFNSWIKIERKLMEKFMKIIPRNN